MEKESQEKKRAVAAKKREKKRQNKKEKQEKEKIPTTINNPDLATDIQGKDEVLEDIGVPPMTAVTSTIGDVDLDDSGTLPKKLKNSDREIGKLGDNEHENQGIAPGLSCPKKGQKEEEGWTEVKKKKMLKRVQVSSLAISRVIGHRGYKINAIREVSGARIEIEKQKANGGERVITIKGTPESTKQAHALVMALVSDPKKELKELIPKFTSRLDTTRSQGPTMLKVSQQLSNQKNDHQSLPIVCNKQQSMSNGPEQSKSAPQETFSSFNNSFRNEADQFLKRDESADLMTFASVAAAGVVASMGNSPGCRPTSIRPMTPQEIVAQRTNNSVGMQPEINESRLHENIQYHNDSQNMVVADFEMTLGSERDRRLLPDTDEERYVHDPDEKKLLNPQKGNAQNWLRQAKLDLKSGKVLMQGIKADPYQGYNSVCLLCHAAVELAVKSTMYATDATVESSHEFSDNIRKTDQRLISLCFQLKKVVKNINNMRYPNSFSIPSDRYFEKHATEALRQSEKILKYISERYF